MSKSNIQIKRLYKLYEKMPNGMNKRSQLSDLTRRAIRIIEHANRTYRPLSLMQMSMKNKTNAINKAIILMEIPAAALKLQAVITSQKAFRKAKLAKARKKLISKYFKN